MTTPTTISQFAERVLMGTTLEEKLTRAPKSLILDPPRRGSFTSPSTPGRPDDLIPRSNDGRSPFPADDQIHDEEQRAILLHFFANHELIAVELMALALLKFPDAPDAFRKGVLRTLQEEQNHTRWYLQRMKECGVEFGSYHLSPMIWSHISNMESPLDYVSRLSLTFEQANLDYAKHYSNVLADAGDPKTAKILGKIYQDEIAHVGYGIKWLRRWKEQSQSDWDAWHQQLHFPVSPIRAKGMVPFNEEGRRKAGLDDHFISSLKRYHSTRGRSPDLYWFNPEVELTCTNPNFTPPKKIQDLAADLEFAFALAAPTIDDLVLLRRLPTDTHREYLLQHKLPFPETQVAQPSEVRRTRNIRSERPWGQPQPDLLSKATGQKLRRLITDPFPSQICQNQTEAQTFIASQPHQNWIAKPLHSAAGRGLTTFHQDQPRFPKPPFLLEPKLSPELEFSMLYQINPPAEGGIRFLGIARQEVDPRGQWISSTSSPKPGTGLPSEQARLISNEVLPFAKKQFPKALATLLADTDYQGPLCIDSFLHRQNDTLKWHPVSEVNARWTMGRLAHQFRTKIQPNQPVTLTVIDTKTTPPKGAILLGDPAQATNRIPILLT